MKKISIMIALLFVLTTSACTTKPKTYAELESLHLEGWYDVDTVITDGLFLVFYYSPRCPDCKSIETEFVEIINRRGNRYEVYLMISMDVEKQGTPPVTLRGVPALYVYQDKVFIEMILGTVQVIDYLESL